VALANLRYINALNNNNNNNKTEFVGFVEREDVKERRRTQTTRDFLLVSLKQSSYVLVVWHRDAVWLKTREFSVTRPNIVTK